MKTPEDYMLPCLNKKLFGVDCPGCGIQRSLLHVTKGEFVEAFTIYPAIYTLIIFGGFVAYNYFSKNKINSKIIYSLGILNIILILTNYFYKLF